MPAKSKAQYRFFQAMKNNPEEAKKRGLSKSEINDFIDPMTKKRFAKLKERISKK